MSEPSNERAVIGFLKTVSTATRFLEFATEEQLNALPLGMSVHVQEMEDLLSRLSLEAEALLWRVALVSKGGRK